MPSTFILTPPNGFWQRIKYLGPSLIVTANIVGAGELIMTTTLGARAGFVALWVILISCMLKVIIQIEFGKHSISTGETSLEAFSKLPGPKWGRGHWSIWTWFFIKVIHIVQMGGIVGGVALALNIAVPFVPVWMWVIVVAICTIVLVIGGKYSRIEKFSVFLIAIFSLFTLVCVLLLQSTEYAVSWTEVSKGLSFKLPTAIVGVAIAAFGITGVSSEEAISYPYWCLEKGYARYTGENDGSDEWEERAKGWIKVMYLDAFISMLIYTITTAAFFILGAAILNRIGEVPEGYATISTLSQIYTESVGPWANAVFLAGAIVVLFSSLFIGAASNQRMITDGFAQLGFLDYRDEEQRKKWFRIIAIVLPATWALLFLVFKAPVIMVMMGGFVLSILLIIVVFTVLCFRYLRLDKRLKPNFLYDIILWICSLALIVFGIQAIINL